MVCLSLVAGSLAENRVVVQANRAWISLLELRVDRLDAAELTQVPEFMRDIHKQTGLGFILTIRKPCDGGAWNKDEATRKQLFAEILGAVPAGVIAYVDFEDDFNAEALEPAARERGAKIIRSFHDFEKTPDNLLQHMQALGGDVAKAAVMTRGTADLVALVQVCKQLQTGGKPFILLGMGEFGLASRVLAPKLGSLLTFASSVPVGTAPAAPGHVSPQTLVEFYSYGTINPATLVYGIIGNPVVNAKSPAYHNPRLRAAGLNAVFLPFLVDNVAAFFELAAELEVVGFSVTIPHKEAVLPFLSEQDVILEQIGACNTVVRTARGWAGTNSDAPGFYAPLAKAFADGTLAKPARALVIGAGGGARGIVQILLHNGFEVCIVNRTLARAEQLCQEFERWYPGKLCAAELAVESLPLMSEHAALLVQTTSVGMKGEFDGQDPLAFYKFDGHEIVYDIIHTPAITPLLERAAAAGCHTINGVPMFDGQAAIQLELYIQAGRRAGRKG